MFYVIFKMHGLGKRRQLGSVRCDAVAFGFVVPRRISSASSPRRRAAVCKFRVHQRGQRSIRFFFNASKSTLTAPLDSMPGLSKSGGNKGIRPMQATAAPSPALQGAGVKRTPSTKPASKKKKEKGKGSHYSTEEIDLIMDIVEEVLPSGEYMWERVAKEYNERKPRGSACRDMESIRIKFRKFKNEKKPTGDPNCPEHVRRAKRIARLIDNHVGATEINDDDENSNEESDDSEVSSIISGSKSSSVEGSPRSQPEAEAANLLDSPVLTRRVLQGGAVLGDMQLSDINRIIPETLVPVSPSQDVHDDQQITIASASSSLESQRINVALPSRISQPARQTRALSPEVRIPLRLGVGNEQLNGILSDVLHKKKKEKSSKRSERDHPRGIPEHPGHSKKANLAREIKDVNDEFKRDKEDHMLRFQAAKREQDLRHLQEMERIRSEKEVSQRRYDAEMAARREERALAERRFDAEAQRQIQAMNMQMGFFAALLGGRGIAPIVQPSSLSSDAALDHQPKH
jgi:hypothetical protein